jgi:hypothetical protein
MSTTTLKNRMNGKLNGQSESAEGTAVNITTALAPVDSNYIALKNNALEIINENLKNQPLSFALFDIVKSPSGGATVFAVPGISGEEAAKELTGIILDYTTPRAYWDTPDPVEGTPPVCFSRDSVISHEGKACSRCEFNTHGSKNGGETNAKACKESVAIFLLRPDNIIPLIVRVPVTSKILFLKYTTRLVSSLTPISGVVTKISLEKATSKQGKPFALYSFEATGALSPEEAATAKAFGAKFMEIVNAADLEPEIAEVN